MRRWLAVLLLVPGCSFALSGPDPDRPRNQIPRCDTSKALVALDGVMATALGVVALSLVDTSEPALALLPASLGALYVGGAVRGNGNVNACRAELDGFAMSRQPALPDAPRDAPPEDETRAVAARAQAPEASPPAPIAPPVAAPPAPALVPAQPAPPPTATAQPAPQPSLRMPPRPPRPANADDEWGEFWREVQ